MLQLGCSQNALEDNHEAHQAEFEEAVTEENETQTEDASEETEIGEPIVKVGFLPPGCTHRSVLLSPVNDRPRSSYTDSPCSAWKPAIAPSTIVKCHLRHCHKQRHG